MDTLTKDIWKNALWYMMFTDVVVLIAESREQVESDLDRWRNILERHSLCISKEKTENMSHFHGGKRI